MKNFFGVKVGLSEAYEGGKIALVSKKSYPENGEFSQIYKDAHSRAIPQSGEIYYEPLINATSILFSKPFQSGIMLYYVNPYTPGVKTFNNRSRLILTAPYVLNSFERQRK